MGMLKSLIKRFTDFIYNRDTLEERLFTAMLFAGTVIAVISSITTLTENLHLFSAVANVMCAVAMIIMIYITYGVKISDKAPSVFVYLLSLVLMPVNFFTCGGFNSGMPVYLMAVILVIVTSLKGKSRTIALIITLIVDLAMIILSYFMYEGTPDLPYLSNDYLVKLDLPSQIIDECVSLVLVAAFIYFVGVMIMNAYHKERENNKKLIEQYKTLSERDALTGLYNRSMLFKKLEDPEVFSPSNYAVLIDIDTLKAINADYGYPYGDKVIIRVTREVLRIIDEDNGEFAARYGGEEFIFIMKCSSDEDALSKVKKLKDSVYGLTWDKESDHVSISAGLVKCSGYSSVNKLMTSLDSMLSVSKESGMNEVTADFS